MIHVSSTLVKDGTHRPSEEQVMAALEQDPLPHQEGYKHAIGKARYVYRYMWRSDVTGKDSNGCTFPTKESAFEAGEHHEKMKLRKR